MSFAAIPSPLNPVRDALGRYKSDRERCVAEIDKLVEERERISAMMPELRRQKNAKEDKVELLRNEKQIYSGAIDDMERQFGGLLGRRTKLVAQAPVRDEPFPEGSEVCVLSVGNECRVVPGGQGTAVRIAHPVCGFVDADSVEPDPETDEPRYPSYSDDGSEGREEDLEGHEEGDDLGSDREAAMDEDSVEAAPEAGDVAPEGEGDEDMVADLDDEDADDPRP